MNILGLDTSTAASAACVLRADGRAFEREPPPEALRSPPAHARELMPAVADVVESSRVGFAGLDAIAVGIGPGTFTGLRIGVATARALALSLDVELRPVSSLAALAEGIPAPLRLAVIDAKRGELFGALYEDGEERWPAVAIGPEELARRVRQGAIAPVAAGDGSVRFRSLLEAAGIRVEPDRSRAHVVRGLHVCRLGSAAPAVASGAVLPEYLRLPDAKPR
jgi:tRNA threonylcarbamoyladenosine biosynthesis protein TsaB